MSQWRFGNKAGLNFLTVPPTVVASSICCNGFSSASQSDSLGNLLFYVQDGGTAVFNKFDAVMANGTNIGGDGGYQSGWIIPKGGSQYYVVMHNELNFLQPSPIPPMTYYGIVDMSLASGAGSVILTSQAISAQGLPLVSKMAVTKHCNGIDYWILRHGGGYPGSNQYFAYLLTSSGFQTNPVVSTIGSNQPQSLSFTGYPGVHKFSPNGRKIAATMDKRIVELYDFDPSSGVVSNVIKLDSLLAPTTTVAAHEQGVRGLEFSPDGSKLYVSYVIGHPHLCQFDLSLNTQSAIAASKTIIDYDTLGIGSHHKGPQLAYDKKIYFTSKAVVSALDCINNPNAAGIACGYSVASIYIGTTATAPYPAMPGVNLPNCIANVFEQKPSLPPISSSVDCGVVNFSAPVLSSMAGYSVSSYAWNFNDPLSGANTSTLSQPTHTFSANGSYTVKLALNYYPCGTDTLKQVININGLPQLGHGGRNPICKNESTVLNFTGASSYTLNSQSLPQNTVQIQPTVTTVYTLTGTDNSGCSSKKAFTITVLPCTSVQELEFPSNLKIYPNPNSGFFSLETKVSGEIIVINSIGQVVFRKRISEGQTEIDMGRHPKGIYILEWKNETTKGRMKLVLE